MQRFHHHQFADAEALVSAKHGQRISVCIPTLNEAQTIGAIVTTIHQRLMIEQPLVDELLVIDSGSDDQTCAIAAAAGARVLASAEILPGRGSHAGKGENLWKALHACSGDLICYVDGDIFNFHSGFVTGLIGPLLNHPDIDYVKAYYERPLATGDDAHSAGGGRISEILVRPLISLFYQDLVPVLQPLSGEYAARREILETLAYPTGYGVEIAHLIDLAESGRLSRVAQTDLVRRVHRNRDDGELGDAAFAILRVVMRRLERDGKLRFDDPLPEVHHRWLIDQFSVQAVTRHLPEPERPAVRPITG